MKELPYTTSPYYHIGRASELGIPRDRFLYRFFECLPGILSWGTIFLAILLSFFAPAVAAIFIILFDLYWLLKTAFLSAHLFHSWKRMKHNIELDWNQRLLPLKYDNLYHMVILPFYNESYEVVSKTVESVIHADYKKSKLILVLAGEQRNESYAREIAEVIEKKFATQFGYFIFTLHPENVEGEMPGKGSNISFAAEKARVDILDKNNIDYKNVLVSAFDVDTVLYPKYFLCLTWHFLTTEDPYEASYQPVPLYNNNLWETPALSRVVAGSATFWQMVQQERPGRLVTFSSHAISFYTLFRINYWQKNMVSEDSRIFWNALVAHNGNYRVIPISYPVSMDANLAKTFWQTVVNIYKQQRRWAWGSENLPYILFNFVKNETIPLRKKIKISLIQIEGYWSLATNPILILILGWLPVVFGGKYFNQTVLSYNLPFVTRNLMIVAMAGLMVSAFVFWRFLPKMPEYLPKYYKIYMIFQWILVPVTIFIFGAIPGLDAQTRLMFGKYMGFWVTPKHRRLES